MIGVAVIGCGLIGSRRAASAAAHPDSRLLLVVDPRPDRRDRLAAELNVAAAAEWQRALDHPDIRAVVVATPNGFLREIAGAALEAGRHVLLEKPMGRNVSEARALARLAETTGCRLKMGFNHRYHPALARAHALWAEGAIGRIINLRARYGHGSRPGCEREWRADPELAGGGELLDQGVHVLDLFQWFMGPPARAVAFTQTAVWPVAPLEDNAFALLQYPDGAVAQLHVSMTQWKNRFSFEIFGERGSLEIEGLGGSYGVERLFRTRRRMEGGVPDVEEEAYPGPDGSWAAEWADFVAALKEGRPSVHGRPEDGLAVMALAATLYRSAAGGGVLEVE
jgi:predicted dehydrogenase